MMIQFVTLIWLTLPALLLSGCGILNPAQIYRVGLLSGVDVFNTTLDRFKAEMVELGYVETDCYHHLKATSQACNIRFFSRSWGKEDDLNGLFIQ
jgi:hypothetical protein